MKIIDSVFFHEDDYCQIELLPIQNLLSKQDDVSHSESFSEEDLLNYNFINIYKRDQSIPVLSELNIERIDFESVVKKEALFSFKEVYTGYSSARFLEENIYGWGFENYVLYYECIEDTVTKCWFNYSSISQTLKRYPKNLQTTLFNLGVAYDLFLLDWREDRLVILKNNQLLKTYIEEVLHTDSQ